MSLAEIQQRRSMIARGELTDSFGFAPDFSDQLKSMNDLEKTLAIKEAREEQRKAEEKARLQGEYHIDLNIVPDVFHKMIRDIRAKKHSEYILPGGRGSMKSSTISLIIPELLKNNPNMHALILRKVGNTIKDSVYAQMLWAINALGLNDEFKDTKSPLEITYEKTGQKIYFRGCDDPMKLKGIKPTFGYVGILWKEEKDQLKGAEEERSVNQSVLRGGDVTYDFSSYNPPKSSSHWVYKEKQTPKDKRVIHKSNYLDAPTEWLGQKFIDDAEHLKAVNPTAYDHEYMGNPTGSGTNVFDNLEVRKITDEEYDAVLSWMYLNDLEGFTQEPSAADGCFIPDF